MSKAERCACGTHSVAACAFAGACKSKTEQPSPARSDTEREKCAECGGWSDSTAELHNVGCSVLAERAPSGEAATRQLGDLGALLPDDFMWGDALQPHILCGILNEYDARSATPEHSEGKPASNAAAAAPGDLPVQVRVLAEKWNQDAIDSGFAMSEPACEVFDLLDHLASNAGAAPAEPKKELAHGHRDDFYLMANGRRIAQHPISMIRTMPNWALASELFATGSNSARRICQDAGIDPDAYTIGRAPSNPPVGAKEKE